VEGSCPSCCSIAPGIDSGEIIETVHARSDDPRQRIAATLIHPAWPLLLAQRSNAWAACGSRCEHDVMQGELFVSLCAPGRRSRMRNVGRMPSSGPAPIVSGRLPGRTRL
jgi:hypothetical protein